jgi:hypothetical protein
MQSKQSSEPSRLNYGVNRMLATLADRGGVLSFAVVRNPWVRFVSGFRDKVSQEVPQGEPFDQLAAWVRRNEQDG